MTASAQGYKDGVEYFKADQFANAKTLLERNLNDASTDKAVAYYYLGAIAVRDKDFAAAKENFEKGLAANPDYAYNKVGLGELALMNGDTKTAESYFDEAKKVNKKDAGVLSAIGRAYFNADPVKYAKEIEKYDAQAIKADKKEPAIFVLRGDRKAAEKEWGDAAANYENAILYSKGLPEAYVKYANAYFNVNPEYAIAKLQELLQESPTSALGQRELAEKYYENDQWAKAAAHTATISTTPTTSLRMRCAIRYFSTTVSTTIRVLPSPTVFWLPTPKIFSSSVSPSLTRLQ